MEPPLLKIVPTFKVLEERQVKRIDYVVNSVSTWIQVLIHNPYSLTKRYFYSLGACSLEICPCSSGICQVWWFQTLYFRCNLKIFCLKWLTDFLILFKFYTQMRLDFFQFVVTGPSTSTITQTGTVGGLLTPNIGIPYSLQTQCLWVYRAMLGFLCNLISLNLFITFTLIF